MDPKRTAVLIWGSLCAAVAAFFVVSLVVDLKPAPGLTQPMLAVAATLAAGCIAASRLLPPRIKPQAGATPEQAALSRHVVGCALCEGASLFAIVAFMLTRTPHAIAAIGFFALLTLYPSLERWNRLVEPGGP